MGVVGGGGEGGQALLLAWTVAVSCVLYLVRVTGSVVGLAVCFKETCLVIICTYLCICHVVVLRVTLYNM